jgi:hypothetical protein
VVSVVNIITKDTAVITKVKGTEIIKLTVITKANGGAVSDMEKLLMICMEAQIQKCVPLSVMTVQAKTRPN